jgi:mono/diheme cytochrome c family protein
MASSFTRRGQRPRRVRSFSLVSGICALVVVLFGSARSGPFSTAVYAQQSRTVKEGVYTATQAKRGEAIYTDRCASCHGATLGGEAAPALAGDAFADVWDKQPLSDLVNKIQILMPANNPGQLTRPQAVDVVAYILQAGKFPAGSAELSADEAVLKQVAVVATEAASSRRQAPRTAAAAPSSRPLGNLNQVMRGILFPSSNLIFDAQTVDPGARKVINSSTPGATLTDRFAGVYSGWSLVDYASVALAESASLLMIPGRRCENGKPVPVERPDWAKFSEELAAAGRAAYKASQSRNQEAVIEATNQVAESCLNCHTVYRDGRGGAASRCLPQ